MMSVFCSSTPECWKCILRGPDFKIFTGRLWWWWWGAVACPRSPLQSLTLSTGKLCLWCQFFPSRPTLKLLPPIYNLIENPDEHPANKS